MPRPYLISFADVRRGDEVLYSDEVTLIDPVTFEFKKSYVTTALNTDSSLESPIDTKTFDEYDPSKGPANESLDPVRQVLLMVHEHAQTALKNQEVIEHNLTWGRIRLGTALDRLQEDKIPDEDLWFQEDMRYFRETLELVNGLQSTKSARQAILQRVKQAQIQYFQRAGNLTEAFLTSEDDRSGFQAWEAAAKGFAQALKVLTSIKPLDEELNAAKHAYLRSKMQLAIYDGVIPLDDFHNWFAKLDPQRQLRIT